MVGNTRQFEEQQSTMLFEDMQLSRCILSSLSLFFNIIAIIILYLITFIKVDRVLFIKGTRDYHGILRDIEDYY